MVPGSNQAFRKGGALLGVLTTQSCHRWPSALLPAAGSIKAFFKGNGTNVVKIAPETAIKLTMNDILKKARGPCLGVPACGRVVGVAGLWVARGG